MLRLLGTGAGIIFKGSGFYETDYKKNGSSRSGNGASKSSEAAKSESKSTTKSETSASKKD
jgi:predicted nucleic acid-binding Zn ribbon protein